MEQKDIKMVRKVVFMISAFICIVLMATAIGGYIYIKSALKPVDSKDTRTVRVSIPIGSSVGDIASILEKKDLVKSATVFRYYVKFRNHADFQAGDYQLNRAMTLEEIIASLKTGKVMAKPKLKLVIPEGKQLDQIATIIAKKTGYKQEEVMKQLNDRSYIQQLMQKYPAVLSSEILNKNIRYPLEGYLFPATYSFPEKKPPLSTIIEAMISKTAEVLAKYEREMGEKKFTTHRLLTMASLIEAEATEKADRQKIASVFYNRLRIGMPLQTDPTVLYALGQHKERVYYGDLKVNSPYNTYIHQGLPPGPIACAGEMSIQAALAPAKTSYLYFLATPAGDVIFTNTLADHNREKAKYIGKE
ncbi:endolytic transglycosylase MltG [Anoxybacillus tepidamans]|uniref:endolytic transglycosylase MltG n=1 Tax=Anoxybacteroides tepidamans TaxID=265948 RepID=UPI00048222FC|nr:endolytic transglycosylase MltG [Anoxybacillus tepidamans]